MIQIVETSVDQEVRRSAVELLRVVADKRALDWISTYLSDDDAGVQMWAAGVVDQLLWSDLVEPSDCEILLVTMRGHPNDKVKDQAEFIDSYLEDRRLSNSAQERATDS